MYKKVVSLLALLFISISVVGCNKDAEINSVMAAIHTVTEDVVKRVDANPTAAGVDEAQKLFESRKADLKSQWDGIKGARGFQVGDETKKKMAESYVNDLSSIRELEVKHMSVSIQDAAFKSKLEALIKDWEETFKIQ